MTARNTVRARQVGYDSAGRPLLVRLPGVECLPGPNTVGARHVGYTAAGIPVFAQSWECCDGFCPDGVSDADCYVQPDCWPLGPGPGISKILAGYLSNVNSCPSADGILVTFAYDAGTGKWVGSDTFGGHTYTYTIACVGGVDPSDPAKFTLTVSVDGSPPVTISSAGAVCLDPLTIVFTQIPPDGCGCGGTDTPAEIQLTVRGNCRKTVWARHVGYTAGGVPIFARENNCFFGPPSTGCWLTCGLLAVVTRDPDLGGDCSCLANTYALTFGSGAWHYGGGFGCPGSPGTLEMSCSADPDHPGKLCLSLTIVCAAAVTATAVVCDIDPADLDTLDVTFDINIDNTTSPCTGGCVYTWIAMAGTWSLADGCDPPECGPCPNAPVSPPGSPVDGQVHTESCPNPLTGQCCKGLIHIRVTR